MKFCTFPCVFTNWTQYSRLQSACKPKLHVNHGCIQTMDDPHSSPMMWYSFLMAKKTVENTQIWWCCVKIGEKWQNNEKWGIISWGKVQNGIRSTPLYMCFQRKIFDAPHGHHEFCMQFWPTETDSHAVSHFRELWSIPHSFRFDICCTEISKTSLTSSSYRR